LTASDTKFAPIAPNAVAYFAAVGTDADPAGASGQQIVATNHNGCWFPSWLNRLKFYAFRISSGDSSVILSTDSGGANIFDPYKIQFFNVATGALVAAECPGGFGKGIPGCGPQPDRNSSAAAYQAILSQGGSDRNSAIANDIRATSFFKCVDPADASSRTLCMQSEEPVAGQ